MALDGVRGTDDESGQRRKTKRPTFSTRNLRSGTVAIAAGAAGFAVAAGAAYADNPRIYQFGGVGWSECVEPGASNDTYQFSPQSVSGVMYAAGQCGKGDNPDDLGRDTVWLVAQETGTSFGRDYATGLALTGRWEVYGLPLKAWAKMRTKDYNAYSHWTDAYASSIPE